MEEVVNNAENLIKAILGVIAVQRLSKEDCARIMELEEKGELETFGMERRNEGLREVLRREIVFAVVHSSEFRAPKEPIMVWTLDGEVVGEMIPNLAEDKPKTNRFSKAIFVSRDFVIYRDRFKKASGGRMALVFPKVSFPELSDVRGVRDVVSGSPSGEADNYVKRKIGVNTSDIKLGTVLVGFNAKFIS